MEARRKKEEEETEAKFKKEEEDRIAVIQLWHRVISPSITDLKYVNKA